MNELLELQKEIESLRTAKYRLSCHLAYLSGYLSVNPKLPLSVEEQNKLGREIDDVLNEVELDRY